MYMKRTNHPMNQGDFFDSFNFLLETVEEFLSHRTAGIWFRSHYGQRITDGLTAVANPITELDAISHMLRRVADGMIIQLEGYEEYELCAAVKSQHALLAQDLERYRSKLMEEDK